MKAIKRLTALVLMLCILLAALPVTASAATGSGSCGPSLTWSLDSSGTLTISGNGDMYDYDWGGAPWYEYCDSIYKVIINSGVRYIGSAAFIECYNITSVIIPYTVTRIGIAAFAYCEKLTAVTIPSSVYKIGGTAFAYSGLTSIKLSSSVREIGENAFLACLNLKKIEVERSNSNYSSDSAGVLFDKNKTILIQAPGALTGGYTVPNSVVVIGSGAFAGCTSLTAVTISARVTDIGDWAFEACITLKSISVVQSNGYYSSDGYGVLFDKNKTKLIQAPGALAGHYTVPSSVKTVGPIAFEACINLTGVTLPGSVTEIKEGVFAYCENLTSVSLPKGITSIPDKAFAGCSKLKNIAIPSGVGNIGSSAFSECTALSNITIPSGMFSIGDYAFSGCISLKSLNIPDGVFGIGEAAFAYCTGLTSVEIGEGLNMIYPYAFYCCVNLTTVKIDDGIEEIGKEAFYGCNNLTSITIPRTLDDVRQDAFKQCENLITVFYSGKTTEKSGIAGFAGNDAFFFGATWHYECVELQGAYPAYYCGECDKCFFLDNTESHFTDVLTDNWQFTHAKYAVEHNLMAGTGTDAYGRVTFLPDKAITREEFVQVLYNAEGKPAVESEKVFPDVAEGGWYKNAVLWAFENNIASGLGDGNFGIGRKITRQDLALMLYKYAGLCGYSQEATAGVILQYGDGSVVSNYAKTAMDWAVTNGILSGKGTAGKPLSTFRLDPAGTATRAECAAMLRNFMTKFNP